MFGDPPGLFSGAPGPKNPEKTQKNPENPNKNRKNIIGRFTKVSEHSDKYGNILADYDLFSDNYLNFKIGDIIIGLDSNTIGIILRYDYKYNSLHYLKNIKFW